MPNSNNDSTPESNLKSVSNLDGAPPEPEPPQGSVRVAGVVVLIALDDGSLRQAHVDKIEHMRTIVDICTMNEKNGLKLGSTDFSHILDNPGKDGPKSAGHGDPESSD